MVRIKSDIARARVASSISPDLIYDRHKPATILLTSESLFRGLTQLRAGFRKTVSTCRGRPIRTDWNNTATAVIQSSANWLAASFAFFGCWRSATTENAQFHSTQMPGGDSGKSTLDIRIDGEFAASKVAPSISSVPRITISHR
jgi:hypothetical protein